MSKECEGGLIFKPYESIFFDKKTARYEQKRGLRLLKRNSCNNCHECEYIMEQLEIDASECYFMVDNLDTNKLYRLVLVDEYEVEFKEIK